MGKIYPGEYSIYDIVRIASDSTTSMSSSPFAPPLMPVRIVKRAAPWKGIRGMTDLKAAFPKTAAAVEKAYGISKEHHEKGVVLVEMDTPTPTYMIMPRKSAMQSIGRPSEVGGKYHVRVKRIVATGRTVMEIMPWVVRYAYAKVAVAPPVPA